MYNIVLKDGKIINVNATEVEWCREDRMIKLFNERRIVARINMDNVVGWIDADYKAESEEMIKCCVTCKYHHLDGTKEPCASCIRNCFSCDDAVSAWERKD